MEAIHRGCNRIPFVSTKLRYICFPEFPLNEINYATGQQYKFRPRKRCEDRCFGTIYNRFFCPTSENGSQIFQLTIKKSLTRNRIINASDYVKTPPRYYIYIFLWFIALQIKTQIEFLQRCQLKRIYTAANKRKPSICTYLYIQVRIPFSIRHFLTYVSQYIADFYLSYVLLYFTTSILCLYVALVQLVLFCTVTLFLRIVSIFDFPCLPLCYKISLQTYKNSGKHVYAQNGDPILS